MNTSKFFECKDILHYTKNFLDNKDIIELISCSKKINKIIGKNNIFTSIAIFKNKNICDMIRIYLMHKKSIYKIVLVNVEDPFILWPFGSQCMVFINCGNLNKKDVYDNYKESKEVIIRNKYNEWYFH
jgi:hypothetical protein